MRHIGDYEVPLSALASEQRLRVIPGDKPACMTDFTSNDYLGIASEGSLQREFLATFRDADEFPPFTSVASRLLATVQRYYSSLEATLEAAYGMPALLFNSGYHANTGAVSALAARDTLIVADKLVHASIIDGIRLSGASFKRFAHNDIASLRRILEREAGKYLRQLVIVESVYSMDGDLAPLREIAALKGEFAGMRLYVDEAHGLGVFGPTGLGLCEELGLIDDVDVLVGTFGKALASEGAFVAASPDTIAFLRNSARSFIFSTALAPMNVAYTQHTFTAMRGMAARREHLQALSHRLSRGLSLITGADEVSASQIVPWIVGGNARTVEAARRLRLADILAMPIRRPTVPQGSERLRFSINASLTTTDIDRLLDAVRDIAQSL